jgi:predicted adenine nucleotide alpha hydrolase (AANH) superfamily ATPase
MKILIHQCCGPCSFYPFKVLLKNKFEVTSFFYNPNIHPYTEFFKRLENAKIVNKIFNVKGYFYGFYSIRNFLNKLPGSTKNRCFYCYDLRLRLSAAFAKKKNFEYFTTTLLYSKYQQHHTIKDIAQKYANLYNIKFYYYDFREGWQKGIEEAKDNNIFMQNYCGCIFSEEDRHIKKIKKKRKLEYV